MVELEDEIIAEGMVEVGDHMGMVVGVEVLDEQETHKKYPTLPGNFIKQMRMLHTTSNNQNYDVVKT